MRRRYSGITAIAVTPVFFLAGCAADHSTPRPSTGESATIEIDFSTNPRHAWTIDISEVEPGDQFLSPHRMAAMYEVADAYEIDGLIIAALRDGSSARLGAFESADGRMRWNIPLHATVPEPAGAETAAALEADVPTSVTELTCARAELERTLPCVVSVFDSDTQTRVADIHYFELSDGSTARTLNANHADAILVAGDSIVTASWAPDRDLEGAQGTISIARGTIADPGAQWLREFPIEGVCFGSGDGFTLDTFSDYVYFSSVSTILVNARTGEPVIDAELSSVSPLSADRFTATVCEPSTDSATHSPQRSAVVGDSSGQLLHEHRGMHTWNEDRVGVPEDTPYVASYSIFDPETGEEIWRLPSVDTSRVVAVVGTTLVTLEDTVDGRTVVGYHIATGEQLWRLPGDDLYHYEASDGTYILGRGGADMSTLTAVDATTGNLAWTIEVPDASRVRVVTNGIVVSTGTQISYYKFS